MTVEGLRYRFIKEQVLEFFELLEYIEPEWLSFPLDMVKILKSFADYRLCSYQDYSSKFNIPIEQVIENCQSNSGCTFYNKKSNSHLIVFNKLKPQGRQKWTLAHELGHCFLSHFDEVCDEHIAENNITSIFNKNLESEADCFASLLLAPFPLYKALGIRSETDIQTTFGLSEQASKNRFSSYLRWENSHYTDLFDENILRLFQPFCLNK